MIRSGMKKVGLTAIQLAETMTNLSQYPGIQLLADENNVANIFVGPSFVSNGQSDGTIGFPLGPGKAIFLPTRDFDQIYVISTEIDQVIWFLIV